jgi:hypothetical protein
MISSLANFTLFGFAFKMPQPWKEISLIFSPIYYLINLYVVFALADSTSGEIEEKDRELYPRLHKQTS